MIETGIPRQIAATAVGVHASTLRRWHQRSRRGQMLVQPRGPQHERMRSEDVERAKALVRSLHGLVGVESLRKSVPGLTRRAAARIKAETCRALERERKQGCLRVSISYPGVLRGFDAMAVGSKHLLIAGDGCVPYRTHWELVPRYNASALLRFLERDFDENGAPLILRLDRAKQHTTTAILDLLDRHNVLLLQGPPRRAQFYGQLERQNLEHRQWLERLAPTKPRALRIALDEMMRALNSAWRRQTLGWSTAAEAWTGRLRLRTDRAKLREEVARRTQRLRRREAFRGKPADLPRRLAIQIALARRGLLTLKPWGWC
jgi:hypothetical protein